MELLIDNRQNFITIDKEILELMEKAIILCLKLEELPMDLEVSLSFVDDDEIQYLNKTYRGKDKVTDVLSFPLYENINEAKDPKCLGDIVISLQQAERQALEYGHTFKREVIFLTVHSMFHLIGYDHDTLENKKIMRQKEEVIMKEMGILRE